ncbi:hypothetical protein H1R20_g5926, partial [Candolleomyces eurysporus]
MDSYRNTPPLWDFTSAPNSYPQMPDIDFMSILDKFPGPLSNAADGLSFGGVYNPNPNPLDTSNIASSSRSTPSDDSPSPTASQHDQDEADAPAAKRKATEDVEDGPSSKNQHTMKAPSASTSSRRKSTGNPAKDETRLMKRKEQNRAAQRAFRERKEKHVKDLEDKVAQLEAKNEEAVHENENLRDLLNRLQTENVMLKRGQFTFSMPRDGVLPFSADLTSFAQPLPTSPTETNFAVPSATKSLKLTNPLDWSSLTTFDPSRLNLLDDITPSQTTATDSAMQLDFGFGQTGLASNTPYTTLTSNPMFMSFASSFDATSPPIDNSPNLSTSTNQQFDFHDLNSLTAWPSPPNGQDGSFDDLLQGYLGANNNNGLTSFLTSPASASPAAHHVSPSGVRTASSSSSPSSSSTDPLFTPKDSATPESDGGHRHDECPKTRAELAKRIEESGPSPFAPSCNPVRKSSDGVLAMISCDGATSFPKTQKK